MRISTFQNNYSIGFATFIVVLLTAKDDEIISDMRKIIIVESNYQRDDIRGEVEEEIGEFDSATGDTFPGNAFQPLAVALAHIRNARIGSPNFVSFT